MFISILFTQAFFRVDVFVLKALRSLSEVSLFFAPYLSIIRLQVIPQTIVMALFPTMSRLADTSSSSFEKNYEKTFRFLLMISLPIAMVTTVLAEKIILLLFGESFKEATISLQILIWAIVLTFLDALLLNVLISLNKQRILSFIFPFVFLVNLLLDLILVPLYGYVGACIGSLAAYMVRFCLTFYYVSKYTCYLPLNRIVLKPAISVLIMNIFMFLAKELNLFFAASLGMLMYLISLILLGNFTKDDIALLKRALTRT
jgi:O-antigen/teichoic acid export membrane protein